MNTPSLPLLFLALLGMLAGARNASAAQRHFAFSYESAVLGAGQAELQPLTSTRVGHADYYSRLEARLGFQFGLSNRLQAGLLWDLSSTTEDLRIPGAALNSRLSSTELQSLSAQLRYELTSPVADVLGSALFLEGSAGPLAVGYQGRVILDKQLGSLLLTANLVSAGQELLELQSRYIGSFGATLAGGYFATPNLVPGVELHEENTIASSSLDQAVLYLGPSISFVSASYWLTFAATPQVVTFKGATPGHRLDVSQNEYLQARLLLGFPL